MIDTPIKSRYQWSKLNGLQLGRYAEHWAKMRLIEAGYEVYSAEVDDRGIDLLLRTGPGRCLEIQVKSVRNRNVTSIKKSCLGETRGEVESRLRSGYCMLFMLFEDGVEPQVYLIPGYAWFAPNIAIKDDKVGDKNTGPCLVVQPSKRNEPLLEPYRLNDRSIAAIVEQIKDGVAGVAS